MKKSRTVGPFSIFRYRNKREGKNFVDISLKAYENSNFGWNWGSDGTENIHTHIRLFGLEVLRFEPFAKGGFDVRFLGFWWING